MKHWAFSGCVELSCVFLLWQDFLLQVLLLQNRYIPVYLFHLLTYVIDGQILFTFPENPMNLFFIIKISVSLTFQSTLTSFDLNDTTSLIFLLYKTDVITISILLSKSSRQFLPL